MNDKGFTLIELLAVIVILAIIALIATPIILNIINNAKEEGVTRSAENYVDSVELAVTKENLEEEFNPSVCQIQTDGNLLCDETELKVEVNGSKPSEGWIQIDNGKIKQYSMFIDNSTVTKTIEKTEVVSGNNVIDIPSSSINEYYIKATTEETKTTGIVPATDSSGNIIIGSEFEIKVNETIGYLKFFVLSNDGNNVNLIAEQNITNVGTYTSEPQDNDEWYVTSSNSFDNKYGPQTAYTYLSNATNNWTNIPIIESFSYEDYGHKTNSSIGYQSIVTQLDSSTGKYITTITPLSSTYGNPVTYENMRARLPYYTELNSNTKCTMYMSTSDEGKCLLWSVNYLSENSNYLTTNGKVNSTGNNYGYWTLDSLPLPSVNAAIAVSRRGHLTTYSTGAEYGVRPVITIPKADFINVIE